MTDEERQNEGAEEAIEDLEAPAAAQGDVVGGVIDCQLPTKGCANPTCTSQTWCKPGTHQGCVKPTCGASIVYIQ